MTPNSIDNFQEIKHFIRKSCLSIFLHVCKHIASPCAHLGLHPSTVRSLNTSKLRKSSVDITPFVRLSGGVMRILNEFNSCVSAACFQQVVVKPVVKRIYILGHRNEQGLVVTAPADVSGIDPRALPIFLFNCTLPFCGEFWAKLFGTCFHYRSASLEMKINCVGDWSFLKSIGSDFGVSKQVAPKTLCSGKKWLIMWFQNSRRNWV